MLLTHFYKISNILALLTHYNCWINKDAAFNDFMTVIIFSVTTTSALNGEANIQSQPSANIIRELKVYANILLFCSAVVCLEEITNMDAELKIKKRQWRALI